MSVVLEDRFTLSEAEAVLEAARAHAGDAPFMVDAAQVERVSTVAIQTLAALAADETTQLQVQAASPEFLEAVTALGLDGHLCPSSDAAELTDVAGDDADLMSLDAPIEAETPADTQTDTPADDIEGAAS